MNNTLFTFNIDSSDGMFTIDGLFSFYFQTVPLILFVLAVLLLRSFVRAWRQAKTKYEESKVVNSMLGVVEPNRRVFPNSWWTPNKNDNE